MELNNNDQNAQRVTDQNIQDQKSKNQNLSVNDDGIEENSEQTPLAEAVNSDEPEKGTFGSEGGGGWDNNKPGATNEEKDGNLIPTSDPENYTS